MTTLTIDFTLRPPHYQIKLAWLILDLNESQGIGSLARK
jgi:hypothetical protein